MADNATLPATGVVVRTKDHSSVETQIVGFDLNPAGAEQLMASAALADGTSNPTLPSWATLAFVYNGTTWDRLRGDTTNGAWVNVKASALPSGAATSAKQPALGTAGTASADVITVQGIASGTVLPVDTELPAAAALADGAANPTTPTTGAAGLVYNGSTWDRARGDTTNGAWVNIKAGTVTSSGSDSTPNVSRKVKGITPTRSSVNDSASSQTLLSSNSNRLGCTIVNNSTSTLYMRLSANAAIISAGNWDYVLYAGDTWEHPNPAGIYTGEIRGIWDVDASGYAEITEYT